MKKYWDEVEIGHAFGIFTRPALSRVQLAHFAAATDDFSALHLDDEFAKSAGFGSVFAHNLIALGLCQDAWQRPASRTLGEEADGLLASSERESSGSCHSALSA